MGGKTGNVSYTYVGKRYELPCATIGIIICNIDSSDRDQLGQQKLVAFT